MTILHIANDFSGSKVYKNLIASIDSFGESQIVYTAVRNEKLVNLNTITFSVERSEIIYSNILKLSDRLFFNKKVNKIQKDIEAKVDLRKIDIIHAHTWYSDGAVARYLSIKYRIPYIIAVRNTDLNVFYKYLIHTRGIGRKILENSKAICFISQAYLSRFQNIPVVLKNDNLRKKAIVLMNGVDDFWINNYKMERSNGIHKPVKVIYVGKFDSGKNVLRLIEAIKMVNREKPVILTLIGGGGNENDKVLKCVDNKKVFYLGAIVEKKLLKQEFLKHDIFAMPSLAETFGLVYIEALSQGLPILYSKNEGIDGAYDNVGESVVANDVFDIQKGLIKIIDNFELYENHPEIIKNNHSWNNIALKYVEKYKEIMN